MVGYIVMKRFYPILFLVIVLGMNFLANYLPIGGRTTGGISDAYPSLFTPAGFTFSIWGIIYQFLIGYVIFQALPVNRSNELFDRINRLFIINCVANSTWILAWHYDLLFLSLIIMAVILTTLILIYRRIASVGDISLMKFILVKVPFSLYLGWITVATIANISIIQSAYEWNDLLLIEQDWTLIKLALAGAVGAAMILQQKNKIFGLVVAWATYGIYSNQIDSNVMIAGAAATIMILILVSITIEIINSNVLKH